MNSWLTRERFRNSIKIMNTTTETKKVKLTLCGLNGNAFSLMGAFSKQARHEGWTKPEIDAVLNKAMDGDYNNLLRTLMEVCKDVDDEEND